MLENLEKARNDKGVTLVEIADAIGVSRNTISLKISGEYDFKFGEALKIHRAYFPEYDITYLFTPDKEGEEVEA